MPRTKTGTVRHQGHKAVLSRTKGFRMTKNRLYKVAKEADLHAGQYAFIGRKLRKRNMRSLWITRISAAVKLADKSLNYSRFMKALKDKKINLDRKVLSQIAATDESAFRAIVKAAAK
ncbi:MAG TPA: 50S ribosomal protein L20 [Candidatus Saccharimonadia bacterium]|nr:50S ribosomal protein L20 [Candidatus Saccharimonadia bacterium]